MGFVRIGKTKIQVASEGIVRRHVVICLHRLTTCHLLAPLITLVFLYRFRKMILCKTTNNPPAHAGTFLSANTNRYHRIKIRTWWVQPGWVGCLGYQILQLLDKLSRQQPASPVKGTIISIKEWKSITYERFCQTSSLCNKSD